MTTAVEEAIGSREDQSARVRSITGDTEPDRSVETLEIGTGMLGCGVDTGRGLGRVGTTRWTWRILRQATRTAP